MCRLCFIGYVDVVCKRIGLGGARFSSSTSPLSLPHPSQPADHVTAAPARRRLPASTWRPRPDYWCIWSAGIARAWPSVLCGCLTRRVPPSRCFVLAPSPPSAWCDFPRPTSVLPQRTVQPMASMCLHPIILAWELTACHHGGATALAQWQRCADCLALPMPSLQPLPLFLCSVDSSGPRSFALL